MAKKIIRESQTSYTVQLKSNEPFDKPFVIKRKGRRVAVVIPLAEYKQFVAWRETHPAASITTTRRHPGTRKRKGDFTKLIGIFKAQPGQAPIDFSALMNKHGYEQIDRDDS